MYKKLISIIACVVVGLHAGSISEFRNNGQHPKFCIQAATNPQVFKDFKRHPICLHVIEGLAHHIGLQYYEVIKSEFPEILNMVEMFRENDAIGNPLTYEYKGIGKFSPPTIRFIKVAAELEQRFGDLSKLRIIEIGGGYGGQCQIVSKLGFKHYTIVDLPETIQLVRKYIETTGVKNVSLFDRTQIDQVNGQFDLIISNYAFSEIGREEQQKYITKIIEHVPNGYMLMNFIKHDLGFNSLTADEVVKMLEENGRSVSVEPENPRILNQCALQSEKNWMKDTMLFTWKTPENSQ